MKRVSLKLIPSGRGEFTVQATNRGTRYPYHKNPIGLIAQNDRGDWSYTSGSNPGAGPIYGNCKTPERAAMQCYRNHRSWVGY